MRWGRQNVNPMLVLRNAICNRRWHEMWVSAIAHRQALRTSRRHAHSQQQLALALWILVFWGARAYRLAHPPAHAAPSTTATARPGSGYSWRSPFLRRPPSTPVEPAEACAKRDTVGEVFKRQEQQSEKFGFCTEELPPANPVSVPH